MQLSPPISLPNHPEPAAPGPGLPEGAPPPPNSGATAGESFEHYMPRKAAANKAAPEKEAPDAGKMSAILAASLWLPPVLPPALAPAVPAGAASPAPSAVENLAAAGLSAAGTTGAAPGALLRSPGFLAAPSARIFGSVVLPLAAARVEPGPGAAKIPPPPPVLAPADSAPGAPPANPAGPAAAGNPLASTALLPPEAAAAFSAGTATMPAAPVKRAVTALARAAGKNLSRTDGAGEAASGENSGAVAPGLKGDGSVIPAGQVAIAGPGLAREKTAAGQPPLAGGLPPADPPEKKDFLKTAHVAVTAATAGVGTRVAEDSAAMPVVAPSRSKTSSADEVGLMGTAATGKPAATGLTADAPAPAATLRETISVVISAVDALERGAAAGQNRVDFQFQVGGEHLSLHVELRDGTVHTTFRTESSELRTALAQEWQSVVSPAGGRDVRLADPVFSSGPAGGQDASFGSPGQGASHRQARELPAPAAFPFAPDPADAGATAAAPVAAPAAKSNQLLSAFA